MCAKGARESFSVELFLKFVYLEKQKSQLFYQQNKFIWEDQRNLQFGSCKLCQTIACPRRQMGGWPCRYQEETGEAVAALHWLQAVGRLLPGQEGTFLPAAVCDLW